MIKCVVVVPTFNFHLVNQMINQNYVSICAIVTEDRIVAAERGLPKELTYAIWQFREVVQNLQPDYIFLLTSASSDAFKFFNDEARQINFPAKKIVSLTNFLVYGDEFDLAKRLETYEQNPNKSKIFVTGLSYAFHGIRSESFDLPLINFAFPSQDLYYDYEISKKILDKAVPPRIYITTFLKSILQSFRKI